ncbi:MAG: ABC transporter substrate-binding protein [Peptostreptococcaceae bacterium]
MNKSMIKKLCLFGITVTLLTGCSSSNESSDTTQDSQTTQEEVVQEESTDESNGQFVLKHVPVLVEKGYEDIVLDSVPERIVCLSTAPVLALHEMGVDLLMVPQTTVLEYPEDLTAEVVTAITAESFDLESIIDADPELVLIPESAMETHGKVLQDAGIPCYVIATTYGLADPYGLIKEETKSFTDAFSKTPEQEQIATELMERFDALDAKMVDAKERFEGTVFLSTMVTNNMDFYAQQESSTLGSVMKALGFENAYNDSMGGSNSPVSLESLVDLQNDLMIFINSTQDPEVSKQSALDAMAVQSDVWNSTKAVQEDKVLYLTTNYWVFGGIQVIDSIDSLIDLLDEVLS